MEWFRCNNCGSKCCADDYFREYSGDGKWMVEGNVLFHATNNQHYPWTCAVKHYASREEAKAAAENMK